MSAEPIDPERWESLLALQEATGRDFLKQVIDLYLSDTPRRLADLRTALSERDAARAERLAHSIKGSSSNIGAPLVESLAAELEARFAAGSLRGANELVAGLESEIERVTRILAARRPP